MNYDVYWKDYYKTNRKRAIHYQSNYYDLNQEKIKNYQRTYYLKNKQSKLDIKNKNKNKLLKNNDNIYELTPKRIHDIKRVIKELDCKETKDKLYDMMDRLQNKPDNQAN